MEPAQTITAATAVVQAISAGVIAWLTWGLVRATNAYANSAGEQVKELVEGRLAAIAPFLHLTASSTTAAALGPSDPWPVSVELTNLGSGPAIDVVGQVAQDQLALDLLLNQHTPQTVPANGICRLAFEMPSIAGRRVSDLPELGRLQLTVEYSDLAGRH